MATTRDDVAIGRRLGLYMEKCARHNTMDEQPFGLAVPMEFSFALTAADVGTINNVVRLLEMPSGSYILDFRGTPTDMDSGGSPALAYSVLLLDSAGVTKQTLASGSTNAQAAAGSDRIANGAVGKFCGGYFLALKFTTAAATGAAGTYGVYLSLCRGVVDASGDIVLTDTGI